MNVAALTGIGISILILIALSGLFSFSEMALATVNKIKIQKIASDKKDKKNKKAKRALELINSYNESITSIVIMNNIVNILATTLSAIFFVGLISTDEVLASMVSFVVMTFSTIIFGELTPKMLAKRHSLKGTLMLSNVIFAVVIFFKPITLPIKKMIKDTEETLLESDEDIKHALIETHEAGHIDEEEKELLHKALDMDEISIKQIMIPIKNVVTINNKATKTQIKKIVINSAHTRFPIINEEGRVDGILNSTLFLKNELTGKQFDIKNTMFEVSLFEKKMKLDDALQILRSKRQKLAMVVDEKEKPIGILTIEDILEELVGELYDESDIAENGIMQIEENHFIINEKANAKEALLEVYNSRKTVDKKASFAQFLKKELKIKSFKDGDRLQFRNSLIWIKKSEATNITEFEIDIIE